MKFAPSTGCFYPDDIEYPEFPHDVVDVTDEDFQTAMNRPEGVGFALIKGKIQIVAKR